MERIRDLQERKLFYDAVAEQERLQREADTKPIKNAIEENNRLAEQNLSLEKELIQRGERDSEFRLPDDARLSMSKAEAQAFAKAQAEAFVNSTPAFYPCPENHTLLVRYLLSNGINIPTVSVFKAAFNRLSELGLLKERPTQRDLETEAKELIRTTDFENLEAVQQTKEKLAALQAVKDSVPPEGTEQTPETESQEEIQDAPSGFVGTDGRTYSDAELSAMSSEEFRRISGLRRVREYSPVVQR